MKWLSYKNGFYNSFLTKKNAMHRVIPEKYKIIFHQHLFHSWMLTNFLQSSYLLSKINPKIPQYCVLCWGLDCVNCYNFEYEWVELEWKPWSGNLLGFHTHLHTPQRRRNAAGHRGCRAQPPTHRCVSQLPLRSPQGPPIVVFNQDYKPYTPAFVSSAQQVRPPYLRQNLTLSMETIRPSSSQNWDTVAECIWLILGRQKAAKILIVLAPVATTVWFAKRNLTIISRYTLSNPAHPTYIPY